MYQRLTKEIWMAKEDQEESCLREPVELPDPEEEYVALQKELIKTLTLLIHYNEENENLIKKVKSMKSDTSLPGCTPENNDETFKNENTCKEIPEKKLIIKGRIK